MRSNIALRTGEVLGYEAARVVLPGFEWLEAAAAPSIDSVTHGPTEYWNIVDPDTGFTISHSFPFRSIDEAIADAVDRLRERGITPEKYRAAQQRARERMADIQSSPKPPRRRDR